MNFSLGNSITTSRELMTTSRSTTLNTQMIRNGFIIIGGIALVQLAFNYAANLYEGRPALPADKFKIVDQYGPCEVVRYSPDISAKYSYFLDCK